MRGRGERGQDEREKVEGRERWREKMGVNRERGKRERERDNTM